MSSDFTKIPRITEPMTMITDYILGIIILYCAWKLYIHAKESSPCSISSTFIKNQMIWKIQLEKKTSSRTHFFFWKLRIIQKYMEEIISQTVAIFSRVQERFITQKVNISLNFESLSKEHLSNLNFLSDRQRALWFWMLGFISCGIGAFGGGISHGFKEFIGDSGVSLSWTLCVYCFGLTTLLNLCGTIFAHASIKWQFPLLTIACLEFLFYSCWMMFHDSFFYVMLNYSSGAIAIIVFELREWKNCTSGSYIIAGIVLTFFAGALQQSGFGFHEHFNHNDIYHIIQMFSMVLLYLGVRRYKFPSPYIALYEVGYIIKN